MTKSSISGTSNIGQTSPSPEQISFGGILCSTSLDFYEGCLVELMRSPWRKQNAGQVALLMSNLIQGVSEGKELVNLIQNNPEKVTMDQFRQLLVGFGLCYLMDRAIRNYQQQ